MLARILFVKPQTNRVIQWPTVYSLCTPPFCPVLGMHSKRLGCEERLERQVGGAAKTVCGSCCQLQMAVGAGGGGAWGRGQSCCAADW